MYHTTVIRIYMQMGREMVEWNKEYSFIGITPSFCIRYDYIPIVFLRSGTKKGFGFSEAPLQEQSAQCNVCYSPGKSYT